MPSLRSPSSDEQLSGYKRHHCAAGAVLLPYGLAITFGVHHLFGMRSRRMSFIIGSLGIAGLLMGCARTVWLPDNETPECRAYKPPGPPPLHLVSNNATRAGSLIGQVVDEHSGEPVSYARVVLRSPRKDTAITDSHGRFRLDSVGRKRLIFSTGRIGFHDRTDTLTASPGTGFALSVPMREFMLDGPCSGFALARVREPWWKFWVRGVRDSSLKKFEK